MARRWIHEGLRKSWSLQLNGKHRVRLQNYLLMLDWYNYSTVAHPLRSKSIIMSSLCSQEKRFIHADSGKLTVRTVTELEDMAELNVIKNKLKLMHTMLWSILWDSLTFNIPIEIISDETDLNQGQDYDELNLWQYI